MLLVTLFVSFVDGSYTTFLIFSTLGSYALWDRKTPRFLVVYHSPYTPIFLHWLHSNKYVIYL